MRLIFLGPPGAGKGTQVSILAKSLAIPHISTGVLLRQAKAEKTSLGLKAQEYMDTGKLVPDTLVLGMVRERLIQSDTQLGWILDGFPRTLYQSGALDGLLVGMNQPIYDHVISLEVSDEIVIPRIAERAIKENRLDDSNPDIIHERLQIYHNETAPLINFYKERNLLISVNGNKPVKSVTSTLKKLLDSQRISSNN